MRDQITTILVALISIALFQSPAHSQAPNFILEEVRAAGFSDALGFVVADESTYLFADTAGTQGSSFVWRIVPVPDISPPPDDSEQSELRIALAHIKFVTLPMRQPAGLELSPDNTTLYICDMGDRRIFVCDASTGNLTNALDVPGQPRAIRTLSGGSLWYLTADGRFHRRNLKSGRTTLLRDTTGDSPHPIEIDDAFDFTLDVEGQTIYVTRDEAGEVIAINTETGAQHTIAEDLATPRGIEFVKSGDDGEECLIVAEEGANRITVISLADPNQIHHVSADSDRHDFKSPLMVRKSSNGNNVFVTATDAEGQQPIIIELSY